MKRIAVLAAMLLAAAPLMFSQELVHRSDSLSQSDPQYETGGPVHWYSVAVKAGHRLAIRAVSVDFDPIVVISTGEGKDHTVDGSAGSVAYSYSAESDATIKVGIAASQAPSAPLPYLVRIAQIAPEAPLVLGEKRTRTLAYDDETLDDNRAVDYFPIHVTKGQRLSVAVWSDDFDPSLVGTIAGGADLQTEQAASGHAIARFTALADGDMKIGVTSQNAGENGSYTVQVLAAKDARPVSVGDTVKGSLRDGDDMLAGQPMDAYRLHGTADERVVIHVASTAFDPILYIEDGTNDLEQNDDISSDSRDSELQYTFKSDGDLELRVYSIDSDGRGAYDLTVSEAPAPQSLNEGDRIEGELAGGDEVLNGKLSDRYVLTGRAGESVTVTLESEDFDAYLLVTGVDGTSMENDDVADQNTNASIVYHFPSSGRIEIIATSYSSDESGKYVLTIGRNDDGEGAALPSSAPHA